MIELEITVPENPLENLIKTIRDLINNPGVTPGLFCFILLLVIETSELKKLILDARVLQEGHYIFADGGHALKKLEMDSLWDYPENLDKVLKALANYSLIKLPRFDAILGVPSGGQKIAMELSKRELVKVPVVRLERMPGGKRRDFRFVSEKDKKLALTAKKVCIYEDVVTTLGSVAAVAKLLDFKKQEIYCLAIWRRGVVKNQYNQGIKDYYLIEEDIPTYSVTECPICAGK